VGYHGHPSHNRHCLQFTTKCRRFKAGSIPPYCYKVANNLLNLSSSPTCRTASSTYDPRRVIIPPTSSARRCETGLLAVRLHACVRSLSVTLCNSTRRALVAASLLWRERMSGGGERVVGRGVKAATVYMLDYLFWLVCED
jgi:hypothetical protein